MDRCLTLKPSDSSARRQTSAASLPGESAELNIVIGPPSYLPSAKPAFFM